MGIEGGDYVIRGPVKFPFKDTDIGEGPAELQKAFGMAPPDREPIPPMRPAGREPRKPLEDPTSAHRPVDEVADDLLAIIRPSKEAPGHQRSIPQDTPSETVETGKSPEPTAEVPYSENLFADGMLPPGTVISQVPGINGVDNVFKQLLIAKAHIRQSEHGERVLVSAHLDESDYWGTVTGRGTPGREIVVPLRKGIMRGREITSTIVIGEDLDPAEATAKDGVPPVEAFDVFSSTTLRSPTANVEMGRAIGRHRVALVRSGSLSRLSYTTESDVRATGLDEFMRDMHREAGFRDRFALQRVMEGGIAGQQTSIAQRKGMHYQ